MSSLFSKLTTSIALSIMASLFLFVIVPAKLAWATSVSSQQINNATSSTTASNDTDMACQNTTGANGKTVDQTKVQNCLTQSPIVSRIQQIVDFLSAGVGIIVVGVILVGGIQYTLAGANPQRLTAARQRITNGLIALFAFLFIFAFLQWLIPGGIFK
ncbi:MAG: hypothetical protein ACREGG_01295 [Candidatus Saccharimonadales bacterium]